VLAQQLAIGQADLYITAGRLDLHALGAGIAPADVSWAGMWRNRVGTFELPDLTIVAQIDAGEQPLVDQRGVAGNVVAPLGRVVADMAVEHPALSLGRQHGGGGIRADELNL
jgi:hypothetical protein